jgi:hypothetical protein
MAKRGRPSWQPPDLNEVAKLAASGLTFKQIASALGIHVDTLVNKRREFSEFSAVIEKTAPGRSR